MLAWGEQAGSGVEYTAGIVEGVCGPAAPMVEFLLDAPATLIESITGEVYDVEGVHDRGCIWELVSGCVSRPGFTRAVESRQSIPRLEEEQPSHERRTRRIHHAPV